MESWVPVVGILRSQKLIHAEKSFSKDSDLRTPAQLFWQFLLAVVKFLIWRCLAAIVLLHRSLSQGMFCVAWDYQLGTQAGCLQGHPQLFLLSVASHQFDDLCYLLLVICSFTLARYILNKLTHSKKKAQFKLSPVSTPILPSLRTWTPPNNPDSRTGSEPLHGAIFSFLPVTGS